SKSHVLGIVVVGERESVERAQPSMFREPTLGGTADFHIASLHGRGTGSARGMGRWVDIVALAAGATQKHGLKARNAAPSTNSVRRFASDYVSARARRAASS